MKEDSFWEKLFRDIKTAWGFEPSYSAVVTSELFKKEKIKTVLLPGSGYGRNAKIFLENGIKVTGIEISKYAITLGRQTGLCYPVFHGSVTNMPFSKKKYSGIFSYALLHLLNKPQRSKLIRDCFSQLKENGYMVFTMISKKDSLYKKGKPVSTGRLRLKNGLCVYFYDKKSAKKEFANTGLVEIKEIDEPVIQMPSGPVLKCIMVICKKTNNKDR